MPFNFGEMFIGALQRSLAEKQRQQEMAADLQFRREQAQAQEAYRQAQLGLSERRLGLDERQLGVREDELSLDQEREGRMKANQAINLMLSLQDQKRAQEAHNAEMNERNRGLSPALIQGIIDQGGPDLSGTRLGEFRAGSGYLSTLRQWQGIEAERAGEESGQEYTIADIPSLIEEGRFLSDQLTTYRDDLPKNKIAEYQERVFQLNRLVPQLQQQAQQMQQERAAADSLSIMPLPAHR